MVHAQLIDNVDGKRTYLHTSESSGTYEKLVQRQAEMCRDV